MPDQYFSGPSRTRFLNSLSATVKFIDTYIKAGELEPNLGFDVDEFVAWIHGVVQLRHSGSPWKLGEHVPIAADQWNLADTTGAGRKAATVVLRHYNLLHRSQTRQRPRHAEQEAHLLTEAMLILNGVCRDRDSEKRRSTFCLILDDSARSSPRGSPTAEGPLLSGPLAALEGVSTSISRIRSDEEEMGDLQATLDIRQVWDGPKTSSLHPARSGLLLSLRTNPRAYAEGGVLYVLMPSLVNALGWEAISVSGLVQLVAHSREAMPWTWKAQHEWQQESVVATTTEPPAETVTELSSAEKRLTAILERFGAPAGLQQPHLFPTLELPRSHLSPSPSPPSVDPPHPSPSLQVDLSQQLTLAV